MPLLDHICSQVLHFLLDPNFCSFDQICYLASQLCQLDLGGGITIFVESPRGSFLLLD